MTNSVYTESARSNKFCTGIKDRGKSKAVTVPAMKAYRENGGTAPHMLNLGTSCQPHASATSLPGKALSVPVE
jgi:hypothetical protein